MSENNRQRDDSSKCRQCGLACCSGRLKKGISSVFPLRFGGYASTGANEDSRAFL